MLLAEWLSFQYHKSFNHQRMYHEDVWHSWMNRDPSMLVIRLARWSGKAWTHTTKIKKYTYRYLLLLQILWWYRGYSEGRAGTKGWGGCWRERGCWRGRGCCNEKKCRKGRVLKREGEAERGGSAEEGRWCQDRRKFWRGKVMLKGEVELKREGDAEWEESAEERRWCSNGRWCWRGKRMLKREESA